MNIDDRIISEIKRYHNINRYLSEQDTLQDPNLSGALAPPPGGVQAAPNPVTDAPPPAAPP